MNKVAAQAVFAPRVAQKPILALAISMLWILVVLTFCTDANGQTDSWQDHVKFVAEYQLEKGSDKGVILLTAKIGQGSHIYALKQPGKLIPPSEIKIGESRAYSVDEFIPNQKPMVKQDPILNTTVAKHQGKVIFWAPFKLAEGQARENVKIELSFKGSVCTQQGMCYQIRNAPVPVAFGGYYDKKAGKIR